LKELKQTFVALILYDGEIFAIRRYIVQIVVQVLLQRRTRTDYIKI